MSVSCLLISSTEKALVDSSDFCDYSRQFSTVEISFLSRFCSLWIHYYKVTNSSFKIFDEASCKSSLTRLLTVVNSSERLPLLDDDLSSKTYL